MGQRLKGIATNVDWSVGFRQVPDLIQRAAEATAAGYANLGAGIGGGMRAIAAKKEQRRQEGREDDLRSQMWAREDSRYKDQLARENERDAMARAEMGDRMANNAQEEVWKFAALAQQNPDLLQDKQYMSRLKELAGNASAMKRARDTALGQVFKDRSAAAPVVAPPPLGSAPTEDPNGKYLYDGRMSGGRQYMTNDRPGTWPVSVTEGPVVAPPLDSASAPKACVGGSCEDDGGPVVAPPPDTGTDWTRGPGMPDPTFDAAVAVAKSSASRAYKIPDELLVLPDRNDPDAVAGWLGMAKAENERASKEFGSSKGTNFGIGRREDALRELARKTFLVESWQVKDKEKAKAAATEGAKRAASIREFNGLYPQVKAMAAEAGWTPEQLSERMPEYTDDIDALKLIRDELGSVLKDKRGGAKQDANREDQQNFQREMAARREKVAASVRNIENALKQNLAIAQGDIEVVKGHRDMAETQMRSALTQAQRDQAQADFDATDELLKQAYAKKGAVYGGGATHATPTPAGVDETVPTPEASERVGGGTANLTGATLDAMRAVFEREIRARGIDRNSPEAFSLAEKIRAGEVR